MANHRDGGRDPTELALTVQPANTARPVETTKTIIPQPVMRSLRADLRSVLWNPQAASEETELQCKAPYLGLGSVASSDNVFESAQVLCPEGSNPARVQIDQIIEGEGFLVYGYSSGQHRTNGASTQTPSSLHRFDGAYLRNVRGHRVHTNRRVVAHHHI